MRLLVNFTYKGTQGGRSSSGRRSQGRTRHSCYLLTNDTPTLARCLSLCNHSRTERCGAIDGRSKLRGGGRDVLVGAERAFNLTGQRLLRRTVDVLLALSVVISTEHSEVLLT